MSFLYDPKIYLKIIEGQANLKGLSKAFDPPPDASSDQLSIILAKKLMQELDKDFSGAPKLDISTAVDGINLDVKDLQSLSTFALFLFNNRLTINGSRVILSRQEYQSLQPGDKDKFLPIPVVVSKNPNAPDNVDDFYYNVSEFPKYLVYLKEKASSLKKNKDDIGQFMEVMLNKLLNEINSAAGNVISEPPSKSTPQSPNDIPDEEVVDMLDKEFDFKNPYAKGGTPLRAKDIKSKEDLNAWLRANPEATILTKEGNVFIKEPYSKPNSNKCDIVNILYLRAKNWANIASPAEKAKYNFYLKKIQEIGPEFTGPNGQCVISGSAATVTTVETETSGMTQKGKSPMSNADLNKVIQSLPLRTDRIRFALIREFFKQYVKFAPDMSTYMENAEQAMKNVTSYTVGGTQDEFNMMANISQIKIWLKAPQGKYFIPFIDNLKVVLENTRYVISDLRSKQADADAAGGAKIVNQEYLDRIEAQIGQTGSIYEQNMRQLETWENQVKFVKKMV